jgi:hypothetical protein
MISEEAGPDCASAVCGETMGDRPLRSLNGASTVELVALVHSLPDDDRRFVSLSSMVDLSKGTESMREAGVRLP